MNDVGEHNEKKINEAHGCRFYHVHFSWLMDKSTMNIMVLHKMSQSPPPRIEDDNNDSKADDNATR